MSAKFLNSISWLFSIINLFGYVLIVKKEPLGFILIIIANIFWIMLNNKHKLYCQSITLLIFIFINIWGLIEWHSQ